jgi:hypothetical protein
MRGEETHTLRAPRGERALFVPPKFACPFMRVVPLNYVMLHTQCVANQRPPARRVRGSDPIMGALAICKGVRACPAEPCPAEPSGLSSAGLACPCGEWCLTLGTCVQSLPPKPKPETRNPNP